MTAGTYTRDYPIDLPAGAVNAQGDAIAYPAQLPHCAPEQPTEGTLGHGLRVLAFILAESVTATLSDLELERAEYAAGFAVTAREILPIAVTRISDVRHIIASILKTRKAWDAVTCDTPTDPDRRPIDGPMAKLTPRPIANPPAGAYGELRAPDRGQF